MQADHYQEIGGAFVGVLPSHFQKALLYAEVEDGVVGHSAFYQEPAGRVTFVAETRGLVEQIYRFWEDTKADAAEWRSMAFVIENGRFSVDLVYPDQLPTDEEEWERRPRIVRQYFGTSDVLYPSR